MIKGARKPAAAPLEIGEDAVPPLGAQRLQALFEEAVVVHRPSESANPGHHTTPPGLLKSDDLSRRFAGARHRSQTSNRYFRWAGRSRAWGREPPTD